MTAICLISGAIALGFGFMYITLRIGCWMDGREW